MGPNDAHSKPGYVVTEKDLPKSPPRDEAEPLDALKRRLGQLSVDLWIWELGSLLLCTMCVGAIIAILLRYDNQPLPSWSFGLTINGVISVLAVIAKASMILPIAEAISQLKWHWYWRHHRPILDFQYLDAASRGPWGCLMLLCRPRQWSVSSIGALITVAALLMEPSLQLIPSYYAHPAKSGSALIPRSVYYKDYFAHYGSNTSTALEQGESISTVADLVDGFNVFSDKYRLGTNTKEAFYGALFGSAINESTGPTPVCSTGNCTWPKFSSLGVCSSCTNLTTELQWGGGGSPYNPDGWYMPNDIYTIRNGTLSYVYALADPLTPKYNQTRNQTILDMLYLSSQNLPGGSWTRPQAFECIMYFCVKTYSASMHEGVFREDVISSWPGPNGTLRDGPNLGRAFTPYGPSQIRIQNYTLKPPELDAIYAVDSLTAFLLDSWLTGVILQLAYYSGLNSGYDSGQDLGQFFYDAQRTNQHGSSQLSGPGPVFASIAEIMTSRIRNAAKSDVWVTGAAFSVQTHVGARWYWAVFPVTLIILAFAFMALTIFLSIRNGIPVWKSSSLVVLVHGLGDDTCHRIAAPKLNIIEANAEGSNMGMTVEKSMWRLEGVLNE